MKWIHQAVRVFISGALLVVLVGSLIAFAVIVSDLPSRIYTEMQSEYLSYNYSRMVKQAAPTWNVVTPVGAAMPADLTEQETWVRAVLAARYEEQAGVSVTAYDLDFQSEYRLAYPGPAVTTTVELFFSFPGNLETLHDVRFEVDGAEPADVWYTVQVISWRAAFRAGDEHRVAIGYRADGVNSLTFGLNRDRRLGVLDVTVQVDGLQGSGTPKMSLPFTRREGGANGETFTWRYDNLIANRDIQLDLPTRLGLAQRVARLQDDFGVLGALAPVVVILFLLSLAGMFYLSGISLRLEGYLLIGCALALFFPTLTFLSGWVGVMLAALIALLFVCGLVLTFVGLSAGWRQTWGRVGWLLVLFLGLFSLGVLTPGRGLFLTLGGLLLVGTFMILYALRPAPAAGPEPEPRPQEEARLAPPPVPVAPPALAAPPPPTRHCPHCGHPLNEDYAYCPACGHDARSIARCAHCGHEQFIPPDLKPAHCLRCGRPFK